MEFIEPRNINADKVDWLISERVRAIVSYYAEYTEYTESDVVDKLLTNILDDKKFIEWIKSKRNNKRIIKQVNLEHLIEEKEEEIG
jgi:RimJ/RimL family protein N-acetyltransferase